MPLNKARVLLARVRGWWPVAAGLWLVAVGWWQVLGGCWRAIIMLFSMLGKTDFGGGNARDFFVSSDSLRENPSPSHPLCPRGGVF